MPTSTLSPYATLPPDEHVAEAPDVVALTTPTYDEAHRARATLGTAGIPASIASGLNTAHRIAWFVTVEPQHTREATAALWIAENVEVSR